VKSSPRFWLAAAFVVSLSLAPKVVLDRLRASSPPPPTRAEQLRRFLAEVSEGPVSAIAGGKDRKDVAGWRFEAGRCAASAFPSSPSGTFDIAARSEAHATAGARMAYVYRGAVSCSPPTWSLALDTIAFRAVSPFSPSRTYAPGYTVLVFRDDCSAATTLPWSRFRSD
jgi:hypothetical protein